MSEVVELFAELFIDILPKEMAQGHSDHWRYRHHRSRSLLSDAIKTHVHYSPNNKDSA